MPRCGWKRAQNTYEERAKRSVQRTAVTVRSAVSMGIGVFAFLA